MVVMWSVWLADGCYMVDRCMVVKWLVDSCYILEDVVMCSDVSLIWLADDCYMNMVARWLLYGWQIVVIWLQML